MKINMNAWKDEVIAAPVKCPLPILTFPAIKLLGISVNEMIGDSDLQAKAMKLLADRHKSLAAVSMMDLSLEAEAFGSKIRLLDNEVPVVVDTIVNSQEDAESLAVPPIGAGRTLIYLEAVRKAVELINDRPVFAGVIGPFSLAGRLIGTAEIMKAGKRKPQMVHTVMEKCTHFITSYIQEYHAIGAHGLLMAEPLTGLLPPQMAVEFSEPYVKQIIDGVQSEDFMVIYHNCGNNSLLMIESILRVGAQGYHFGDAVKMEQAISQISSDILCLGNVSPGSFVYKSPDEIYEETVSLMSACAKAPNFIISSGCDIPPTAEWNNIDAFYKATEDFYARKGLK